MVLSSNGTLSLLLRGSGARDDPQVFSSAADGYTAAVTVATPPGYSPYPDAGDFLDWVGPVHSRIDDDRRVFGLRIEERHRNRAGAAQGGLLATLVDFALGRAVQADDDDGRSPTTVSLTTDFLGAVHVGDWVEARTRVERVGGILAFADCSLSVDGNERVRARGVFSLPG